MSRSDERALDRYRQARDRDLVDRASFPHRSDRIYLVEIGLTYDCQCRCAHCAVGPQTRQGELLTTAEIAEVCRQARDDLGASVVELFGGEPLLRPEIVGIVEACSPLLEVWISTNGIALDRPLARALKKAGLGLAIFSLDSTDPAVHDRLRGAEGSHAAVVRGLDLCAEAGIRAHLSACVTPESIVSGEIDRLIEYVASSPAEKLCLLPAKAVGRYAGRYDLLLGEAEMAALWERIQAAEGAVYVETEANVSGNIGKCFVLRDWLYINPYGVVQPCPYVLLDFGNVRERPLKELYAAMFDHPLFADRSMLNRCLCENRPFVERCLGPAATSDRPRRVRQTRGA